MFEKMISTERFVTTEHVLVEIKGVQKKYGDHVVLEGTNLEVRDIQRIDDGAIKQAQVISLLGPSGIGKTTLFYILAGLLKPTAGDVFIDNPMTPPVSVSKREDLVRVKRGLVGVVYQDYRLFRFKRVKNQLRLAIRTRRLMEIPRTGNKITDFISRSKERIKSMIGMYAKEEEVLINSFLTQFKLEKQRDNFPFQLSGGQRQRVAIAQQLIQRPQLILLDEPFSGLDPETKSDVVKLITKMAKENEYLTIVVISHDIMSALRVSDTVYVMGRNRDAQRNLIPGASIHHDKTIDLKNMDLAWHEDNPEKIQRIADIANNLEKLFPYLSGKV